MQCLLVYPLTPFAGVQGKRTDSAEMRGLRRRSAALSFSIALLVHRVLSRTDNREHQMLFFCKPLLMDVMRHNCSSWVFDGVSSVTMAVTSLNARSMSVTDRRSKANKHGNTYCVFSSFLYALIFFRRFIKACRSGSNTRRP